MTIRSEHLKNLDASYIKVKPSLIFVRCAPLSLIFVFIALILAETERERVCVCLLYVCASEEHLFYLTTDDYVVILCVPPTDVCNSCIRSGCVGA
jgi:hypothetical protein